MTAKPRIPRRQRKGDRLIDPTTNEADVGCDYAIGPRQCGVEECSNPAEARGMCNKHYLRWKRHGDPRAGATEKGAPKKFLQSLGAAGSSCCISWPFAKNGNGYGWAWHEGRRVTAHRLSLILHSGFDAGPEKDAAHKCHNRECVNPHHLHWASRSENLRENRESPSKSRKLDIIAAREIKTSPESGVSLAKRFGVSVSSISKIRQGRNWADA